MIVSQLSNLVNIIKDFDLPAYISTSVMTLIPKKKDQTDHIDNNKINNNKLMSHDSHTCISSMLEEHIN